MKFLSKQFFHNINDNNQFQLEIKQLLKCNSKHNMIGGASHRLRLLAQQFLLSTTKQFKYKFLYGHFMIPHPEKASKGGQDALFISDNVLVVADGVGGWAEHGIDPGKYSKKLCQIMGDSINRSLNTYVNDPKKLVNQAVKQNKEIGTTTVCVLSLNPTTGKLLSYYLGDSVYGFFSKDSMDIMKQQQSRFNCPFQVGTEGNDPLSGIYTQYDGQTLLDKVIVIASDGLWDNYHSQNIRDDVVQNEGNLMKMAQTIAKNTYRFSLMENYASPFSIRAKKEAGYDYGMNGKPDDITIVTAKIIRQQII